MAPGLPGSAKDSACIFSQNLLVVVTIGDVVGGGDVVVTGK